MQTIGFIGVGKIGTEISKHLIGGGYRVLGYRRSSLAEFEKAGGVPARSPAQIAEEADIIFSCLPGGNSLDQVITDRMDLSSRARARSSLNSVRIRCPPRSGRSRALPTKARSSSMARSAERPAW